MGIKSTRKHGFRWRILSFDPSHRVWVGWLGLFLWLNNAATSLLFALSVVLFANSDESLASLILGGIAVYYGLSVVQNLLPLILVIVIIVTVVATAILFTASKFASVKQNLPQSMSKRVEIVRTAYFSLSNVQRYLHLALWVAIVGISILWGFVPVWGSTTIINNAIDYGVAFVDTFAFLQNVRVTDSILSVLAGIYLADESGYTYVLAETHWNSGRIVTSTVGISSSMVLFYALLVSSLTLTAKPTSAKLLKRVFYAFILSLITVLPFSVFITSFRIGSFEVSHLILLLPSYLLLAVVLPYLYFQRARLAEFGESMKRNMRFLAVGGVAMQLFFMVYWAVLTAPEAGVFYIASVIFAVFLALAWAVVLLLVGERTKRDWGLFALIVAVQVASVVVTAPGVVSA